MPIKHFQAFDTECELAIPASSKAEQKAADNLLNHLQGECARYENMLSAFLPHSDIGRINAAGGAPVEVNRETLTLIASGLDVCVSYGDYFDISIGRAARLWDFHKASRHIAEDEESAEAVRHVGWRHVHLDDAACTVQLDDSEMKLDLGGIAKGYIADSLASRIREAGFASATISLGGDLYCVGRHPEGRPWKVSVEDPFDRALEYCKLMAEDAAVVTSGITNRGFIKDGKVFHHILSPSTGRPAQSDLVNVTVVSPSAMRADCLATIMLAAGSYQAIRIARSESVTAVLLRADGYVCLCGKECGPDSLSEALESL